MKPLKPAAPKMNSDRGLRSQRGQILPLGLAFLFVACLGFFLMVSLGRTLIARERHRMQADLTAHAAAVDLARGLNVAASLNKAQAALFAVSAYFSTPVGAYALHRSSSKFIDGGVKAAAAIPEATALYVGIQNGLTPLPLWSHGSQAEPSPLPTFNLTRRYAHGGIKDALKALWPDGKSSAPPEASPSAGNRKRYSYRQRKDGRVIEVDSSQVEKIVFKDRNGKLRTQSRKRDPLSGRVKFVKGDPVEDPFPLDLVETGPHRVTIIGWADNKELFDSRLLPRPAPQAVVASAEAGGGDVELLAWDPNADFDAYLIPVERGLNIDLQKGFELARTLRAFGLSLPDDLSGWTLIAH